MAFADVFPADAAFVGLAGSPSYEEPAQAAPAGGGH